MAQPKPVCHYKVLKECVAVHKEMVLQFRENDIEIQCNCEQNCVDSDVYIENIIKLEGTTELLETIGATMMMKRYPLVRYRRQIIFTFADLFGE